MFNIHYTPYKPKKGLLQWSVEKHAKERAFYDLTGEYNIYKYMTTEHKITGDGSTGYTMLEYLQKCTGVFNKKGMISKEEIKEMKKRLRENEGNIWHGFISFDEDNSYKIDHPDKCLIDNFINAIYLYDDKITFAFNYKDGTKTVLLSEYDISSVGSDTYSFAPP